MKVNEVKNMKKYTVIFTIRENKHKTKNREFELKINEIDENKTQYTTMSYADYTRLIERENKRLELEDPIYMTK